jgi:glycogen debranching enzyme
MDNSPVWDGPLARLESSQLNVVPYRRLDTTHVDVDQRPSDLDYDRYVHLVGCLRHHRYQPGDPRALPFRIRDVLFNATLARAELDLAELGAAIGADPGRRRQRAQAVIDAMNGELWNDIAGMYVDVDATTGDQIPVRIAGGLAPLMVPVPDPRRRDRVIATMQREFLVGLSDRADALLTVPEGEPGFDASCYWRGPAWVNLMWLMARALAGQGARDRAARLERGIAHLVERAGFHEYFDPRRGRGLGADDFSWTAALYLDVADGW